ncbi:unnamed protein product, partial [Meganyctiphanes norvegica]
MERKAIASLAAASAKTLPTCPGTHSKTTVLATAHRRVSGHIYGTAAPVVKPRPIMEGQLLPPERQREQVDLSLEVVQHSAPKRTRKQRHRDTRELKVHQLLVRVEGWAPVGPVTVDKVGVFFRLAPPQTENLSVLYSDLPSARVVMEVTLEGSARKLITVRSALLLTNKLSCPVDIKLDNITMRHGETKIIQVSALSSIAVPLIYAWSRLYVRPINPCGSGSTGGGGGGGGGFLFCQEPLHWFTLVEPHQETANLRLCPAINTHLEPYRFCVQVKRDNFPVDT